ncbi:unnamed protein product, partial [Protopolystoma xenopodis]
MGQVVLSSDQAAAHQTILTSERTVGQSDNPSQDRITSSGCFTLTDCSSQDGIIFTSASNTAAAGPSASAPLLDDDARLTLWGN